MSLQIFHDLGSESIYNAVSCCTLGKNTQRRVQKSRVCFRTTRHVFRLRFWEEGNLTSSTSTEQRKTEKIALSGMEDVLPAEMWQHIFHFLKVKQLVPVRLCCASWRQVPFVNASGFQLILAQGPGR